MHKNEIRVVYGSSPIEMVKKILNESGIDTEINKSTRIGIKPNLVVAKPCTSGATTSPEIVAGVIEFLKELECNNITIMEGSWVGDSTSRAYKVCGYEEISKRYDVSLIDLKKDSYDVCNAKGIKIKVCKKPRNIDYLINMPVLKGHCQTKMTCALKNLKGCIPDSEKRKFHTMGLHKPIAYLNSLVKSDLIVVDGMMGDLDFEEGGNPVQMNRIVVGKDPVLIDAYAAEALGFDIEEIPYIQVAESLGVGSADLSSARIIELNKDHMIGRVKSPRKVERLSKYVEENNACSACYGSLIHALSRLDEKAMLGRLKNKIYIGQGFKGKNIDGIGIGTCTNGFCSSICGCPPSAKEIVRHLENELV